VVEGVTLGSGTWLGKTLIMMYGTTLLSGTMVGKALVMLVGSTVGAGNASWKGTRRVYGGAEVGDALAGTGALARAVGKCPPVVGAGHVGCWRQYK
jgi:hypothetical protein